MSDKDLDKLSVTICLKPHDALDNELELLRQFFGAVRAIFGFVSPFRSLNLGPCSLGRKGPCKGRAGLEDVLEVEGEEMNGGIALKVVPRLSSA